MGIAISSGGPIDRPGQFKINIRGVTTSRLSGDILKSVVIHVSLNSAGGGELVCLSIVEALRRIGSQVTLATVDKTDWAKLGRTFGKIVLPDNEFYFFSGLPKASSNLLNSGLLVFFFLAELLLLKSVKRKHVIINTCGEKMDSIADISYVNGIPLRCASFFQEIDVKRKCVSVVYNLFLKAFDRVSESLIVVNSDFHRGLIEKCIGKKAMTIYPPVSVSSLKHLATKRRTKNIVITCSQYLPTQNLTAVPKIAELVKNANFLILGQSTTTSKGTIEELRRLTAELIVNDRVELLTNQPFPRLVELLSEAKVFLRTLHHEPFGISVVEAMAAGCVPVVPRNGGPWCDILGEKQGKYGYSYRTIDEAAYFIRMLLENEHLRAEISERAQKRATDFDSAVFARQIQDVVRMAYASKMKNNSSGPLFEVAS
jgi:glycosyltransferase involved in cell wall biosynthesis